MRTGDNGLPPTRYVGLDNYRQFQALRREVAMDWEKAWASAETVGKDVKAAEEEVVAVIEADEIPF